MRKSPTKAELDLLVSTTVNSLPDSLAQRKAVLVTLDWLLPRDCPRRVDIKEMLRGLRIHEQAQARFQFTQGKANQ